jgi:peptidoglycan-N-acetylmuramic acid deacetylase
MSQYMRPAFPENFEQNILPTLQDRKRGWGHGLRKEGVRPIQTGEVSGLLAKYNAYYIGADTKKMYLTFDCGYENGYTALILDTLKDRNVKSAFFVTYPFAKDNWQLVERMIRDGHIVGNHSVTHPSFPGLSTEQAYEEIVKLDEYVYSRHGYKMNCFRFPSGEYSERQLALVSALGYKSFFWSYAYVDYDIKKQPTVTKAVNNVLTHSHNGAVVLLHAVSKANTYALPAVIDGLRKRGYELAQLDF